jgi:GcrA cell cycle regulator
MQGEAWTHEKIELLRRLWIEGKTAAAIADCLGGISRSAVLGKIFRLRLAPGEAPKKAEPGDGRRAPPPGTSPVLVTIAEQNDSLARRRARPRRIKTQEPAPREAKRGKSLLELTNTSCRWPFGHPGSKKFHFCGAAGADLERGIPYCARHMQRAYFTSDIEIANQASAPRLETRGRPPAARQRQRIAANADRWR